MNHLSKLKLDPRRPILFASDLHLKARWSNHLPAVVEDSWCGLQELVRLVRENSACALILGGDIFDVNYVKHLWLQHMFYEWVDKIVKLDCHVLAYPGNHDFVISQVDDTAPVHIHSIHPAVLDIDGCTFDHGRRRYCAVGYRDHPAKLLSEVEDAGKEVDTLLLHQLIKQYNGPIDLDEIPANVRQIVLGDVHEFADGTTATGAWWGYPGAMFPQKVNEHDHGVFVIDSDPEALPRREQLYARQVLVINVSDPETLSSQIAIAKDFAKKVAGEMAKLGDEHQHLRGVCKPVVQVRIARHLVRDGRREIEQELGGLAHIDFRPVTVQVELEGQMEDLGGMPTPTQLLDTYVSNLRENQNVEAVCPYPEESATLVRDLLISGAAGRKAGDDERRDDGRPLAHRALIQSALDQVDREHLQKCHEEPSEEEEVESV